MCIVCVICSYYAFLCVYIRTYVHGYLRTYIRTCILNFVCMHFPFLHLPVSE